MSSAPAPDSPTSPPPPSPSDSPPPDSSPSPPSEDASPPPPPPPSQDSNPSSSPPPSSSENDSPPPPPPTKSQNNDDDVDNQTWSPPPPPSSNSRRSPPSPRSLAPGKDSPSNSKSSDGINVNVPVAVGVAVGVGVLLLLLLLVFLCACKKKKKPPKHGYYYSDNHPNTGGAYNNSPQQWNNGNQRSDLTPPPGAMGAGHSPWPSAPLPPGVPMSGDQSSNFSGPHGPALPPPHPSVALGFTKSSFSYEELAVATGGFSQANLLGQGGFGYVHKGVLPNGKEIAVKSLKAGSGQGDREFQAEVEIISRVHHRHLVSLVGYSITGGQKLLVYEFVPNSTLEYHLHGNGRPTMDWPTRLKIALGSAKGLGYLHEDCHPRIIHRDIKGANILIDHNFEAKVADFGLAKLSSDNYTHVSTRVMGTFGYLAPEYASSGKLTEKSDVFSFGVMLLELITGRRPVDPSGRMEDSLVDWARPLCSRALEQGLYDELVDPALEGNYDPHEMACMVASAGLAVSHSARRRPKMSQIVRALEGDISLDNLHEGMKTSRSAIFSSNSEGSDLENSTYTAEMRQFRKVALDSREYPTSEFGQTSEYGLNPSSSSSEEMSKSGTAAARRI